MEGMNKMINPNLLKLAGRTGNKDLSEDTSKEESITVNTQDNIEIKGIGKFQYIPSINLYVSDNKILHGNNWYKCHEELNKQELLMLTIPEFIHYIKYLKQNPNSNNTKILDDILTVRSPWRAEWLDAKFDRNNITYNKINNNKLEEVTETLEECLMEDKLPGIDLEYWLNNHTNQGLPLKNTPKGKLYYYHTRNDTVAWFDAFSVRAGLDCGGGPDGSDSDLGVRAARLVGKKS